MRTVSVFWDSNPTTEDTSSTVHCGSRGRVLASCDPLFVRSANERHCRVKDGTTGGTSTPCILLGTLTNLCPPRSLGRVSLSIGSYLLLYTQ